MSLKYRYLKLDISQISTKRTLRYLTDNRSLCFGNGASYIVRYCFVFVFVAVFISCCKNKSEQGDLLDLLNTPIEPISSITLNSGLNENSGSILWNDTLWLQNDSSEPVLYAVYPTHGSIIKNIKFPGLKMQDWESVAQDNEYIYLGDFGNNFNYRKNLRIFRLDKNSLRQGLVKIDTINFSYEDQVDYTYNEVLDTDYDCESMIVIGDSIYLFTKQWISKGTSVYTLPIDPGSYKATKISEYHVEGLITEAFKFPQENTIVLTGYSNLMIPFFVLLEGYQGNDFFSGRVKKVKIDLIISQIETICLKNGYQCYVTSEKFLKFPPKLHVFDFRTYVEALSSLSNE